VSGSAQEKFSGTVAVGEKDRLDEAALDRWMTEHVAGYAGPLTILKFKGGQSNPTYRLDTPARRYVLRRKPFGPILPSAHAVDREYQVIAALHPTGFPVARPYGLCTDEGVIGAVFYVMECVDGVTHWDGTLPDRTPDERRAIYFGLIDTLAALHQTDHDAIGLGDYGKPGNYFERQVARWTKQYRASETDRIEDVERLIDWLPRTLRCRNGRALSTATIASTM
jgi:aminoglycoside phosphotransferase (APT) family kinase protein